MIGISRKVEDAVVSVLSAQTGLESVAVIQGKDAHTHAFFPRVVVTCKPGKALFPPLPKPISAELELLIQTEAKIDNDGGNCEDYADCVFSALQVPVGVPTVNAASTEIKLDKLEFDDPEEIKEVSGIVEMEFNAELYVS
jgi:hypothetical protein